MASDYPEIGSWWNRRGNEIDILGKDREKRKVLAVEIKNKGFTGNEARRILNSTAEKIKLIEGVSGMEIRGGIAARKIGDRELLESEGFLIWELDDILR